MKFSALFIFLLILLNLRTIHFLHDLIPKRSRSFPLSCFWFPLFVQFLYFPLVIIRFRVHLHNKCTMIRLLRIIRVLEIFRAAASGANSCFNGYLNNSYYSVCGFP